MQEVAKYNEEYEVKRSSTAPPLSVAEVLHRLKNIAGLCYGLSCDVGNMEIEVEALQAQVLKLEAKEKGITPEALKRQRDKIRAREKEKALRRAAQVCRNPNFNIIMPVSEEEHPLTSAEVKNRLKTIAGLCYSLAADVQERAKEKA